MPLPPKRMMLDEERERFERFMPAHLGMPNTHLKITSRGEQSFGFKVVFKC